MIPDKFKIDAFLILIDISKERLEKQPIQDQLGKFYPQKFTPIIVHPCFVHPKREFTRIWAKTKLYLKTNHS